MTIRRLWARMRRWVQRPRADQRSFIHSHDFRIRRLESRLCEVSGGLLDARQLVLDYINGRRTLHDLAVWLIEVQKVVSVDGDSGRLDRMLKATREAPTVAKADSKEHPSWD